MFDLWLRDCFISPRRSLLPHTLTLFTKMCIRQSNIHFVFELIFNSHPNSLDRLATTKMIPKIAFFPVLAFDKHLNRCPIFYVMRVRLSIYALKTDKIWMCNVVSDIRIYKRVTNYLSTNKIRVLIFCIYDIYKIIKFHKLLNNSWNILMIREQRPRSMLFLTYKVNGTTWISALIYNLCHIYDKKAHINLSRRSVMS